ncbi:MAG: enoyl-CoA hydratase/isomerase family protein [Acidimicrobiaceae bacterium]|nr:enoyl-CoA hydratase/isomerase family protein [Acidimicrobiaceae bacterium]
MASGDRALPFEPERFETIRVDVADHVCRVTLDRPEVLNAFNDRMRSEIRSTWRALRTMDEARVVVLAAAGEKAFCAGVDRSEDLVALEGAGGKLYGTSNNYMYDDPGDDIGPKACDLWKPVIAAVNGICCAGAFYLVAESDIVIAAENATFFDPHVTYGMAAVYEPMKLVPRMPLGEVLRLALVGNHERMTAQTAQRVGLVSEVVPPADLGDAADRLAKIIASQPPDAVQGTLRAVWAASDMGRLDALAMAPSILTAGTSVDALAEGQAAFSEGKRTEPRLR